MRYQLKPKIRTDGCHIIVRVPVPPPGFLDESEWNQFDQQELRGFLRVSRSGRRWVEFRGPVSISLYDRLQEPISKYEFFMIMEQILVMAEQLQHHGLSANSVILDLRISFINKVTKELSFLFFPVHDIYEGQGLLPFVDTVIYSSRPVSEEDGESISRFVYFLRSLSYFDIPRIEQYIRQEERQAVARVRQGEDAYRGVAPEKVPDSIARKQGAIESEGCQPAAIQAEKPEECQPEAILAEELEGRQPEAILAEEPKMCQETAGQMDWPENRPTAAREERTGQQAMEQLDGSGDCRKEEETGEETCLLCDLHQTIWPRLYRSASGEVVFVNREEFRIGKDAGKVDYAITDNRAISRKHAEIRREGDRFYISDLNSKNRTFVNEAVLTARVERELFDGDRIRLGDEEFLFQMS